MHRIFMTSLNTSEEKGLSFIFICEHENFWKEGYFEFFFKKQYIEVFKKKKEINTSVFLEITVKCKE